jgi:serine/threonine-protein kinase RsbW
LSAGPTTELRLALPARPENLALVRQALAGLAEGVDIPDDTLADIKQIATEACMNAVVHAYPDREDGRIEVRAVAAPEQVEVQVRDWGLGFRPRPATAEPSLRLGLPLIASVAGSFSIESPPEGGTKLVATMPIVQSANGSSDVPSAPKEAEVAIEAGSSARPVIARVLAMAATRAGFSLDRMSDGVLVGDAIASVRPDDVVDGHVALEITEAGPILGIRVGPFKEGGANRLVAQMDLPGLGASVSKLADRVEVLSEESGEFLAIEIGPGGTQA